MPQQIINEAPVPFWQKNRAYILSFILSIYALPYSFFYIIPGGTDGGWQRAVNEAIKRHLVFGTDFVFTYGPLGYFMTRNLDYVHPITLLLADILLFTCFFYVLYQFISKYKGWFLIIFISIFYYKATGYAQSLFLFFILLTILNVKNNFKKYPELILCAISGTVVFFVKINYGIVISLILLFISIYLLFKNRKALLIFLTVILVLFIFIYTNVNIDVVNYIRYSIPLIVSYNEAMQVEIKPNESPYISTLIYIIVFIFINIWYWWKSWINRSFTMNHIITSMLLCMTFFLMYKNGFTRADGHYLEFLTALPLFTILAVLMMDFGASQKAKIICICAILVSDYNLTLPTYENTYRGFLYNSTLAPAFDYFTNIGRKPTPTTNYLKIPDDRIKLIGNATIDILPIDITTLVLNKLNYDPRPVVQSYSAYNSILDSLNAYHFYKPSRPEYAMIQIEGIDNRYASWDESITKAVLHLNYQYVNYVSFNNDTQLVSNAGCYLLLKNKATGANAQSVWPKFEKMYEREIKLEDTVRINFPDDYPIYMTAEFENNFLGKIKNIIYQAAIPSVSLYYDDEINKSIYHRVVRPSLKQPVLISKLICNNTDFKNFITGDLRKNTSVRAFVFHVAGRGFKPKVKITFYKFTNY